MCQVVILRWNWLWAFWLVLMLGKLRCWSDLWKRNGPPGSDVEWRFDMLRVLRIPHGKPDLRLVVFSMFYSDFLVKRQVWFGVYGPPRELWSKKAVCFPTWGGALPQGLGTNSWLHQHGDNDNLSFWRWKTYGKKSKPLTGTHPLPSFNEFHEGCCINALLHCAAQAFANEPVLLRRTSTSSPTVSPTSSTNNSVNCQLSFRAISIDRWTALALVLSFQTE